MQSSFESLFRCRKIAAHGKQSAEVYLCIRVCGVKSRGFAELLERIGEVTLLVVDSAESGMSRGVVWSF